MTQSLHPQYVGRFAPSPSGPLHFGSLVTALGSFLQSRSQNGKWLLRIEDIDPPREIPGATTSIMRCLEAHHLFWDDEVSFQSQRTALYNEKIDWLTTQGLTYFCQCTRAQLAKLSNHQLCECAGKLKATNPVSTRFRVNQVEDTFVDELLGTIQNTQIKSAGQFAIKRKDGLFAYQLAVVVDDIQQGITEVARGADLLDATFFQLALYRAFNQSAPKFLHFPVVVSEPGKKLSKQNHAPEVSTNYASSNLSKGLDFLGMPVPAEIKTDTPDNILTWAIQNWDTGHIPQQTEQIDNRIGHSDRI